MGRMEKRVLLSGGDWATVTSSRHRAPQTGHTLPEKQRRWSVWLHSDVTVAWPRPMAPWQTGHDGVAGGAGSSQKGFDVAGACCANRLLPVESGDAICAPKEGLVDGGDGCCTPKDGFVDGGDACCAKRPVGQEEPTVAAAGCPKKAGVEFSVDDEETVFNLGVDDGGCPNMPVDDGGLTVMLKEKGVDGAGAGAVAGASLHRAAQTGHAAVPETQRRWNLWAHSDVNAACQSPMPPRQASHWLLPPPPLAMISSGIVRDVSRVFDSIWRLPPSRR